MTVGRFYPRGEPIPEGWHHAEDLPGFHGQRFIWIEPVNDPTNPDYYKTGGIETADFIQAKGLDYCEGNVVKYVTRWRSKNGVEDLKKARWYLEKLIEGAE